MHAIIETGGKQYMVSEGDVLRIEKIENEKSVTFNNVLMVSDSSKVSFGYPALQNATVTADVIDNGKAEKVLVFKQKPRKCYRKLRGHRQPYTEVKIKNIEIK